MTVRLKVKVMVKVNVVECTATTKWYNPVVEFSGITAIIRSHWEVKASLVYRILSFF